MQLTQRREGRVVRYISTSKSQIHQQLSNLSPHFQVTACQLLYVYSIHTDCCIHLSIVVMCVWRMWVLNSFCLSHVHTHHTHTDTVYLSFSISVMASRSYITRQSSTAMKIFRCRPRGEEGRCSNLVTGTTSISQASSSFSLCFQT